ncbi:hypothetical protein [Desulfosarcina sp.]|uniref:hypothetical protein n=1 Tax=Desulfosarcina sp. TaxID=2027861 RepID=UPI0029B02564|nr:hypothetical protein [Desulfosarcina sp.]MDX2453004.1 hypothetical protein [Desulfosarcina sp.]MDX2490739.1 hypothetical protein [Desulfosarcina sp.]
MKAITSYTTVLLFLVTMLLSACAKPNGGNISIDWGNTQAHKEPTKPKVSKKNGPPSHAPAHGYRAKHSYRYYRNEHTYYDTDRNLYFYLERGGWRIAASLPNHIKLSNDFVTVELETDKPYEHYEEHTEKYPPGQMKKWKNKKDKKWAKK